MNIISFISRSYEWLNITCYYIFFVVVVFFIFVLSLFMWAVYVWKCYFFILFFVIKKMMHPKTRSAMLMVFFTIPVCRRPVRVHRVTGPAVEDSGGRPQTGAGPETPLRPHLLHPLLRAAGDPHAGQRGGWGHRHARLPHHHLPEERRGGGVGLRLGHRS